MSFSKICPTISIIVAYLEIKTLKYFLKMICCLQSDFLFGSLLLRSGDCVSCMKTYLFANKKKISNSPRENRKDIIHFSQNDQNITLEWNKNNSMKLCCIKKACDFFLNNRKYQSNPTKLFLSFLQLYAIILVYD